MDRIYYIVDFPADIDIRVQFNTENCKRNVRNERSRHAGNRKPGNRKPFGGSDNRYRNKRPYKRGYRVHEDGIQRREYGNNGRTCRADFRHAGAEPGRPAQSESREERRHKVSYHRTDKHQRRQDGSDYDDTERSEPKDYGHKCRNGHNGKPDRKPRSGRKENT